MGTRSTLTFLQNGKTVLSLYCQFDGYLSGVGKDLCEFLKSGKQVNGIPAFETGRVFNGMGDLAAQFIASVKTAPGLWYCRAQEEGSEDYNYVVEGGWDGCMNPMPFCIVVTSHGEEIFAGSLAEFDALIAKEG